jgi:hypothetical protein
VLATFAHPLHTREAVFRSCGGTNENIEVRVVFSIKNPVKDHKERKGRKTGEENAWLSMLYTCLYMFVCMFVCVHVCLCMFVHVCLCMFVHVCLCMFVCACLFVHVCLQLIAVVYYTSTNQHKQLDKIQNKHSTTINK